MELKGFGLKATISLVFLSFLGSLVRPGAPLQLLAESRNLCGSGGRPEVKKGWN